MVDDTCPECGYPQPEYNLDAVSDCVSSGDVNCDGRALVRAKARIAALRRVATEAAAMLAETNHGGLTHRRSESMRLALEAAGVAIPSQCDACPHPRLDAEYTEDNESEP